MKRIGKALIASLLISVSVASTVFATPSVNALKQDKNKAQKELNDLEKEMTSLMTKINEAEEKLVQTGQAIIQAEEDLEDAEKKEKEQYEAMKYRIVAMYENGGGSMITKIFESGSLAEMLKQAENVQTIHEYDRKQLEEYVKTKEKIASLKTSLEKDMAALEKQQAQFEEDKEKLDDTITKVEARVTNLSQRIQDAANQASSGSSSSSGGSSGSSSGSNYVPPVGTGGGAAIVSAAYKYKGVPYVWGGASMKGVDCSGLVMLAHKAIGVNLSHSSKSIGRGGKSVSEANLQPGDVVCYSGHVGIYVGNGMMIHAPRRGEVVKVVKVYGNPWYRRYW